MYLFRVDWRMCITCVLVCMEMFLGGVNVYGVLGVVDPLIKVQFRVIQIST